MVRVDHVLDWLVGELLHLGDDVGEIDLEFIVDEHHAFVRDERGRIAGDEVVVNDEEVVRNLDGVELRGRVPELRMHVRDSQRGQRRYHQQQTSDQRVFHGGSIYSGNVDQASQTRHSTAPDARRRGRASAPRV